MFDMNAGELSGSGIRVLFYGMPAGASSGVLGRLIEGGVDIAAVIACREAHQVLAERDARVGDGRRQDRGKFFRQLAQ